MKYISLSGDIQPVSRLCLGTAQFGTGIGKDAAMEQLDHFFERGGNFIDTAHVYGDWIPGTKAISERVIGAWLKERKNKDTIIISTKGGHPALDAMDKSRLTEKDIRLDLEESLAALGLDCVDWYFTHRDDPSIPAAEILGILEKCRREGKIRRYGCSNWKLERIEEADQAAREHGFTGFDCNQLFWSAADLNLKVITDATVAVMDQKTFAYHSETKKPVMAYKSACKGYFTKKLSGTPLNEGAEALYSNPSNDFLIGILAAIERETNHTAAALILAYIMAQDFPAVPIASFSAVPQMDEGLDACDLVFPRHWFEEIRQSRVYWYD
jgi:aryl-alcohol dehydrogenase-like predicted oxidoreductase